MNGQIRKREMMSQGTTWGSGGCTVCSQRWMSFLPSFAKQLILEPAVTHVWDLSVLTLPRCIWKALVTWSPQLQLFYGFGSLSFLTQRVCQVSNRLAFLMYPDPGQMLGVPQASLEGKCFVFVLEHADIIAQGHHVVTVFRLVPPFVRLLTQAENVSSRDSHPRCCQRSDLGGKVIASVWLLLWSLPPLRTSGRGSKLPQDDVVPCGRLSDGAMNHMSTFSGLNMPNLPMKVFCLAKECKLCYLYGEKSHPCLLTLIFLLAKCLVTISFFILFFLQDCNKFQLANERPASKFQLSGRWTQNVVDE